MRLSRLAPVLSLALASAAFAQPPAAPTFSADRFKAHVAFLADDRLEGRDTGSRGHEVAAAYVATQFMALGLKPGGEEGGWFQNVPFRSGTIVGTPRLTISGPAGSRTWDNGSDVLIGSSLVEEKQDVTAPVVFVGYGISAPDQGVDDYKGLDVRGKIVVVLSGMPSGLDSEISAHLGDTKSAMAAKHGAVGLITIPTAQSIKQRPWQSMLSYIGRPSLTWLDKKGR